MHGPPTSSARLYGSRESAVGCAPAALASGGKAEEIAPPLWKDIAVSFALAGLLGLVFLL
jgi:hypothetical protein